MSALIDVILPVFLVLGFGYVAAWRHWISDINVDGIMRFATNFASPCLLFKGISTLDLAKSFDIALMSSYYAGAFAGFAIGTFGARLLFKRSWEDSIAIGFIGLFSNALLLGLPITERAYGAAATEPNFAIISIHAPICYAIGITAMEIVKNRGGRISALPAKVFRAMFRNTLVIGITAGLIVNVTGLPVPHVAREAVNFVAGATVPTALFGLGGILYRYKPEGDMKAIAFIVAVSLLVHPAITYGMARLWDLPTGQFRSAVLTASMAPGVNAYLFANLYGHAKRVAASAVLAATVLSILTVWGWLAILP